jgi:PAS domain S-box-containing protein
MEDRLQKTELIEQVKKLQSHTRQLETSLRHRRLDSHMHDDRTTHWFLDCPLPYQSLDQAGCLLEVNPAWLRALGYTNNQVMGRWFGDLLTEPSRKAFRDRFPDFLRTGEIHGSRLEIVCAKGNTLWVEYEGKIAYHPDGTFRQTHCVFQDITKRRRTEESLQKAHNELEQRVQDRTAELSLANEALRQSRERFRFTVSQLPGTVWTMDRELKFTLSLGAGLPALGLKPGQVVGMSLFEFFSTDDPDHQSIAMHRKALQGESVTYNDGYEGKYFQTYLEPLRGSEGEIIGVIGISFDVTEHRRAEQVILQNQQQLRSLAVELSLAEERERKRLAIILHDDICQLLASSKMIVDIQLDTDLPDCSMNALAQVGSMLEKAAEQAHNLTFDLGTPILYELGLSKAISEWLTEKVENEHHISVVFSDRGIPKTINEDISAFVFRSIRELSFNAIKHAQPKNLTVSVNLCEDQLVVEVEDDGTGFSYEAIRENRKKGGGFGLFSIKERLEYMGGTFSVDSACGRGTCIVLRVPITPEGND